MALVLRTAYMGTVPNDDDDDDDATRGLGGGGGGRPGGGVDCSSSYGSVPYPGDYISFPVAQHQDQEFKKEWMALTLCHSLPPPLSAISSCGISPNTTTPTTQKNHQGSPPVQETNRISRGIIINGLPQSCDNLCQTRRSVAIAHGSTS